MHLTAELSKKNSDDVSVWDLLFLEKVFYAAMSRSLGQLFVLPRNRVLFDYALKRVFLFCFEEAV